VPKYIFQANCSNHHSLLDEIAVSEIKKYVITDLIKSFEQQTLHRRHNGITGTLFYIFFDRFH